MAFIKKITACFLLIAMLAPVGYVFIFHSRQKTIRHEMKERLEEKMLHSIVLSEKNVKWFKPGKEIIVDGKMFDVKSVVYKTDGTIVFTGLFDEEETMLVKQLKEQQQKENAKGGKRLIQLIQLVVAIPGENISDNPGWKCITTTPSPFYTPSLSTVFTTIPTPPPQA